jgi:hypothetical protein
MAFYADRSTRAGYGDGTQRGAGNGGYPQPRA